VPPKRPARSPGRAKQVSLASAPTLFTIGYSGHTPDSFVDALKAAKVEQLIDVRSFPRSRKPGFSKETLRTFVEAHGLRYEHMPRLGAPRELLEIKKGGAEFSDIAPAYTRHIAGQGAAIAAAAALANDRPSALMCLEKDAGDCHRGILAKRLAKEGFRVEHL
jgi:uncharacterized protein (DUF488 family)